ncbi:helix-turn-helix domain-containing protein [Candidatus Poriferisodalis sp.]|uniref:helix-turn-helix domain-containing protein n=1 Tax=Candidatus Poriferisodalis sp. TaxID=3101277 RepID=UPI003B02AD8B
MTTPTRLGSSIRLIRKHKNLTQKELAERAGVSLFCLRDLERADRSVGVQNVFKVLAVLECSVSLHPYESWPNNNDDSESSLTS